MQTINVQPFEQLRNTDVESVGGKNPSLSPAFAHQSKPARLEGFNR